MANANTFASAANVPAPKQVVNATTDTALLDANGNALTVGLSNNSNFNNAHPFSVRIRGFVTGGTAATATFKLWLGSTAAAVTGSAAVVFTVTAAAVPTTGGHFDLAATLQWDSTSEILDGATSGHTGATASTAVVSPVASVASVSAIQFVASAAFGAALATNSVTVTEFIIDQA